MGKRKELQRRVKVVWMNDWRDEPPLRYIPRSLDGGTGWGVWDRRESRFVPDAELLNLTFDNCVERLVS